MANPYQPPAPSDEDPPPRPREPWRYFWARFFASSLLLAIWAMGASAVGATDDQGAWRATAGPFWLMHETREYVLGGTLAVLCLLGMLAAMAWPRRYTLAIGAVAVVAWAGCGALAWAIWSGMYLPDTDFIFRIGW
ncbi:MAG TPA: hypothetical protein VGN57_23400 [Pirellulaceae bacterium]|jgi:hypothetical protein|nr:hypothetical protein [Pirellulaceae bacterium]